MRSYLPIRQTIPGQFLFPILFYSADVQEEFHPPPTPPDYTSVTKRDFFSKGMCDTIVIHFVKNTGL